MQLIAQTNMKSCAYAWRHDIIYADALKNITNYQAFQHIQKPEVVY